MSDQTPKASDHDLRALADPEESPVLLNTHVTVRVLAAELLAAGERIAALEAGRETEQAMLRNAAARIAELEVEARACKRLDIEQVALTHQLIQERDRAAAAAEPPRRVIETAEELNALQSAQHLMDTHRCGHVASAAVIRDADGDVYARDVDNVPDEIREGGHAGWWQIGTCRGDIDSSTVAFPVTVLWEPEGVDRD